MFIESIFENYMESKLYYVKHINLDQAQIGFCFNNVLLQKLFSAHYQ